MPQYPAIIKEQLIDSIKKNFFCDKKDNRRTYTGETYKNLHIRSREHIRGFENNDPNNWMIKHIKKEHEGNKEDAEFSWKVVEKT